MVIHLRESHQFAVLEVERLCEIAKKNGRFYSNTAGGQNETQKLPDPEPVPSSPAAANLAPLGPCVMWDRGVLLEGASPGSSPCPSRLLLPVASEMTVIVLPQHHATLTHSPRFLGEAVMNFSLSTLSSINSPSRERGEKGGSSTSASHAIPTSQCYRF